jgi:hypothetical protein
MRHDHAGGGRGLGPMTEEMKINPATATPPEDPLALTHLRVMIGKKRKWNSYWDWPDRSVKERGIVADILRQSGVQVTHLTSRPSGQDPPDCEAELDGHFSGVEVTELVDQETLEQSIRATQRREAGGDPTKPEVFLYWDRAQLLSELQARIDAKDRSWKEGPYERYVLVIHTDEFSLDRETAARFLQGATFQTHILTDVFFGLSFGTDPIFRLDLLPLA